MLIISADKTRYDPPSRKPIENINSGIPLVLVSRLDNFVFNDELLSLDKYCLVNMCEFGWDFPFTDTPIFGKNIHEYPELFSGPEWEKFNDFVTTKPPLLTFQRELLEKDTSDKILSCTYPCYYPIPQIQTREKFNDRPIELFHFFGRSSEHRIHFQSNAYREDGITLIDNIYYLQGYLAEGIHKHIWCSLHIPHFVRVQLEHILAINERSKLSLSMPGCGKRCFRDSESPINSIMVLQDSGVAFPFPWVHGENCIMYKGDDPIPAIKEALKRDDLYDIYVRGVDNCWNYQIGNYTTYIESKINSLL